MSVKENKAAIYRVFKEVTKGNLDIIDEYFADGFIRRAADGTETGRDSYKQIFNILVKTFPDFRITVDDIVAEGDRVAFRFTWSGTVPGAAGNRLSMTEDYFCRFKNGKIIEFNNLLDQLPGHQARLEANKALVRRAYKLSTLKDMDAFFEFLAPEYVEHLPTGDISLKQLKKGIPEFFTAFPDITFTIEDMVAEGDKVAVLMTSRGTHKGEFMGIPATSNKIEMRNTCIIRIANGKLAEWWGTLDGLRMMQQLGAMPK